MTAAERSSASFQTLSYFYNGRTKSDTQIGVIRIHPEGGDYTRGSPYNWAATLVIEGTDAWIYGAVKTVKPSEFRLLKKFLKTLGVSVVEWDRHNGRNRIVQVKL